MSYEIVLSNSNELILRPTSRAWERRYAPTANELQNLVQDLWRKLKVGDVVAVNAPLSKPATKARKKQKKQRSAE